MRALTPFLLEAKGEPGPSYRHSPPQTDSTTRRAVREVTVRQNAEQL